MTPVGKLTDERLRKEAEHAARILSVSGMTEIAARARTAALIRELNRRVAKPTPAPAMEE